MLERFHVPEELAVRVMPDNMKATVKQIFLKMGMSNNDSELAADVLLYADIRGIETHGVSNMLRGYVKSFGEGGINPNPKIKTIREMGAVATIDSDGGHGLVVGPYAMNMAIKKAKKTGVGIGFISAIDRTQPLEPGIQRAELTAKIVKSRQHLIRLSQLQEIYRYTPITEAIWV